MPVATYSDSEIIHYWEDARKRGIGARTLASEIGIAYRALLRRRRRIETKYGPLPSLNQSALNLPDTTEFIHYDHEYSGVIFSDCHWHPNVETPATEVLLKILKDLKPDIIIANGDVVDGWTNSRHSRIGWDDGPSVKEELEACKSWMGQIQAESPNSDLYWPIGNHDIRFDTFLSTNAGLYEGIQGFSLQDHFPDWKQCWSCNLSDLVVVKHRLCGGTHAAHNNAVKAGISIVTGHTHKLRVVPVTDYRGTHYGVETGTLCDPQGPQMLYAEHNPLNMQQGFVVFHMTKEGPHFEPVEVVNGVGRWRGKTYRA